MNAPLDLEQFAGFTPGPLFVNRHDGLHGYIIGPGTGQHTAFVVYGDGRPNAEADATLYAAAPALLAECRRQREEIARLRGALEQLLSAAEHLSGASVASYGSGYAIPQETRDAARAALQQTGVGA